jgi:acetyltransferase-like isoleucine patch superfamily enzyme
MSRHNLPRAGNSHTQARFVGELRLLRDACDVRQGCVNAVCMLMPEFTLTTARAALYRWLGVRLAPRVAILDRMTLTGRGARPYARLSVGEGSIISSHVLFNLDAPVTIGRNVEIAQFVRIYTGRHRMGPSAQRFDPTFDPLPVVIEDGAWIGTGAAILPGVTIGRGSVVSAGSVVRGDVPANTLVEGVPATIVRELPVD